MNELKEYHHKWYLENKEKILSQQKSYYNNNKEKKNSYSKKWLNEHPIERRANSLVCGYRRMDKRNGFGNVIDFNAKWVMENIFTKPCAHCGETGWEIMGCNRLDNSKPHTKDNVEPCCYKCNVRLNDKHHEMCVDQIDILTGEILGTYASIRKAGKITGINQSNITKVCNGGFYRNGKWINVNHCGGFLWRRYFKST